MSSAPTMPTEQLPQRPAPETVALAPQRVSEKSFVVRRETRWSAVWKPLRCASWLTTNPFRTRSQPLPQEAALSVPWTLRDIWIGLGLLALWLAVSLGSIALLGWLEVKIDFGLLVTFWEAALLLPTWWLTVHKYKVRWTALGIRRSSWPMLALGFGLLLAVYLFNMLYGVLLYFFFELRIQADWAAVFGELEHPWLFAVGAAVVAPVVEELFFRGFLFAGLRRRLGWVKAGLISAALFSLIHFTPTAMPPIFLLGCIFALLYEKSRSLWPAILVHATMNAVGVAAAYWLSQNPIPLP